VALMRLFPALGILVLAYVAYAFIKGEVYAKAGSRGRMVSSTESPGYFSAVIAVYVILGVALITVF
jgi:hypothetical protein